MSSPNSSPRSRLAQAAEKIALRTWKTTKRAQFTLIAATGAALLLGLMWSAIYDSVSSIHADTQRVQQSTVAAELSSFVLSLRDSDGTSLIDNPREFTSTQRSLRPVTLRRSFYKYLLNRANARSFTVDKVVLDPPRACTVQYEALRRSNDRLQACFAVVADDPTGRYIYFTLRYPSARVREHSRGERLEDADRVVLDFEGQRSTSITLSFEPPALAKARYPSQMKRFSGLYEVSAFLGNSPGRPLRQVNAQAYERVDESPEGRNSVTLVGRIDAGLIDDAAEQGWPTAAVSGLEVGVQVFSSPTADSAPELQYRVATGARGEAVASFQKAYLANVPSAAKIDITKGSTGATLWSSKWLSLPEEQRRRDWKQRLSDWWAPKLMAFLGKPYGGQPVRVQIAFGALGGSLAATATSAPGPLPDVATRALGWLTAAFALTSLLVLVGAMAVIRLLLVTRRAWAAAVSMNSPYKLRQYGRKRDEISTLGRVLNLLLSRNRSRNTHLVERLTRERKELRLSQELVRLHDDRIDAIGHEIRSPLQALLIRTQDDPALQTHLQRMKRAVEALIDAESVEDGIGGLEIVLTSVDVATYLTRLIDAGRSQHPYLRYDGPAAGVHAVMDPIQFEQVIDHLISNARRYRTEAGEMVVRLRDSGEEVVVEVYNDGPHIPLSRLETIFKYRDSDRLERTNRGIGLFAARAYLLAMKATIRAENQPGGVALVMKLQRSSAPVRQSEAA